MSDSPQINRTNNANRKIPSTRLNTALLLMQATWPLRLVAAASGTNLYMNIKKPIENTMVNAVTQPLISGAFTSFLEAGMTDVLSTCPPDSLPRDEASFSGVRAAIRMLTENLDARKPSFIA